MQALLALAIGIVALSWLATLVLLVTWYRPSLSALWREPVWRQPVLVLGSDDWGAGPLSQAQALEAVMQVLVRHRDGTGRHPVLSLAVVLAVPDGAAILDSGEYRRVELDDARLAPVLSAIRRGRDLGVFEVQLHGLEHFWPPTLMASEDPAVQSWLRQDGPAATENLPSPMQSRWTDARRLPSAALDDAIVHAAIAEEAGLFGRVFGAHPAVVVPPTFVWTRVCEEAWAAQGVRVVVTPGWRYPVRGADGLPGEDQGPLACGDREGSTMYLTRLDYFEPKRGRDALSALAALELATRHGRPCLLENHRDNFIGDRTTCQRSLDELDRLYREALERLPALRFLSTSDVAAVLDRRDPEWLHLDWRKGLRARWARLAGMGRAWTLMRWTGVAAIGGWAVRAVS